MKWYDQVGSKALVMVDGMHAAQGNLDGHQVVGS